MSAAHTDVVEPLDCSAVLTHHWLVRYRGGERVLAAIARLLPGAPLYTLIHDQRAVETPDAESLAGRRVHTSILQWLPGATRHYSKLLPLMPLAARRMRLPDVELVVCSDASIAKAMRPAARSRVVCYCHSPMRYVWDLCDVYRRTLPRFLRPLWGPLARSVRRADAAAASRVDVFFANSRHVADRIRRHYGRDSMVIHPPVDVPPEGAPELAEARTSLRRDRAAEGESFYLCVGHHVPYKRLDLAVAACRRLGRRLVVIGDGPDIHRLGLGRTSEAGRDMPRGRRDRSTGRRGEASPSLIPSANCVHVGEGPVTLLGWQPTEVINAYYRHATALLFPGEEDFGIVPVEAMARGCPVLAYGVGGATETVIDGETGVLFGEQTVDALAAAIERAEHLSFDPRVMNRRMQRFAPDRFLRQMRALLADALARP
jgi:glycosyltransferase involved in cell wall biosynthesis